MLDELIRQAIAERRIVAFRYRGHRRIGEPHLYGRSGGKPQVLVYFTGGTTMAGSYPTWRRCDLDFVARLTVTTRSFQGVRVNRANQPDWDEIWAIVE